MLLYLNTLKCMWLAITHHSTRGPPLSYSQKRMDRSYLCPVDPLHSLMEVSRWSGSLHQAVPGNKCFQEHEAEWQLKAEKEGQHVTNVLSVCFFLRFFPPPDTCLAHKNRETCPCKWREERIYGPQCWDLSVSPDCGRLNTKNYKYSIEGQVFVIFSKIHL